MKKSISPTQFPHNTFAVGGVIALDATTGMILYISASLCQSLGYHKNEISGIYWKFIVENRPVLASKNRENANPAFLLDKTGNKIPCFVESEYREKKEKKMIWNTVFYDLNGKENEKIVENKAIEKTENEIFSVILHDLKSPIDQIEALVNLQTMYPADTNWILETNKMLLVSVEQSKRLIENLNAFLHRDMGFLTNNDIFALEKTTAEVLTELNFKISCKKLNLYTDVKKDTKVQHNEFLVKTVLRNLLHNAVKFTHEGGEIKIFSYEKDHETIILSVEDSGKGIPPELMPILFQPDKAKKRKGTADESGSGLGLYFCKKMLDKAKIPISVQSSPAGTVFQLELKKV
jgi:signal transduction histidine kinase